MRSTAATFVVAFLAVWPTGFLSPGGPPSARAQVQSDIARAQARAMAREGATFYDAGDYPQALKRFLDAYATFPAPELFFNLGQTYRFMGRYAEASEAFERFIAEAHQAGEETRREARAHIEVMRAQIAVVTVEARMPGPVEILIDGRSVGIAPIRQARVAPGYHQLTAQSRGQQVHSERVHAVAGKTVSVTVPAPVAAVTPAPAVAAKSIGDDGGDELDPFAVRADNDSASATPPLRIAGYAATGAGVVMMATGLYFGSQAKNNADEIKGACQAGCDGAAVAALDGDRRSLGRTQWVLLAAGAATAATGAVLLWLSRPSHDDEPAPARVSLTGAYDGHTALAAVTGVW